MGAMEGEGDLRATHRENLESLARQGDPEAISELANVPKLPRQGAHLWAWFTDLHQTRSTGGMGVSRLSRLEIQAWERDEGHRLEAWERRALLAIDAAYVTSSLGA